MIRIFLSIITLFSLSGLASGVELVKDGKPVAEIVLSESASPSVKAAGSELQRHIEKISGAKLPIVDKVSPTVPNQVYIGESDYTRELGISLDDVKLDGFKIVADKNYVVLAGKEFYRELILKKWMVSPQQRLKDWQELAGHKWRVPGIIDFRTYSKELGFFVFDGTGTLYAVYDLLGQLGMRWYMPTELGIVYPEQKNISVKNQNIKREPEFPIREFEPVQGTFKDEFLWYKFMKVGSSFIYPQEHSLGSVLKYPEGNPKENYGVVNGKTDYHVPKLSYAGLRQDLVTYLDKMLQAFPELKYASITPPDGWSRMDDADVAAGWNKQAERGRIGSFSDYTWDFIMDIRKRMMEKYPDLKFITYAYSSNKLTPTVPEKIPENASVVFCQTSSQFMLPASRDDLKIREEWLKKMSNNDIMVFEYYYEHAPNRGFPPIPVIFTKFMKQSFDGMYERCRIGIFVCISWDYQSKQAVLRRPGLSHLMLYLHNRLCWDRNLDMQAVLDEYYALFFGPAKAEMKEFHEFAEQVWTRPAPREITLSGGFLKPADVDRYFDILKRAKAKAGDSVYGKRIDLIAGEMEPLKILFDNLKRTGPDIRGFEVKEAAKIDGDLTKPFWLDRPYSADSFYKLRDIVTGEYPQHLNTSVSFRWLADNSALVVGIECLEPKMDRVRESCKDRDSTGIYANDNVEIMLETPQGIRPKIVVNPAGTVLDECITANLADLASFYTINNVAIKKYPDRWTVELQIDTKPISGERPTSSFPWGVQVNRQRLAGNTPEHYMLSPSGTNFKDLKCMGNLTISR